MKDNISRIRTICKKCKSVVNVVVWNALSTEYTCSKCGYSTLDSDKIEKIRTKDEPK